MPPQITDAHGRSRTCTRMKSQKTKNQPPKQRENQQKASERTCSWTKKKRKTHAATKLRSLGSEIRFFKSRARLRSWERALGRACVFKAKISKPDGVGSPRTYFEQKRVVPSLEPQIESFGFTDSRTVLRPNHGCSRRFTDLHADEVQKNKEPTQNKEQMNKQVPKRPDSRVHGPKKKRKTHAAAKLRSLGSEIRFF